MTKVVFEEARHAAYMRHSVDKEGNMTIIWYVPADQYYYIILITQMLFSQAHSTFFFSSSSQMLAGLQFLSFRRLSHYLHMSSSFFTDLVHRPIILSRPSLLQLSPINRSNTVVNQFECCNNWSTIQLLASTTIYNVLSSLALIKTYSFVTCSIHDVFSNLRHCRISKASSFLQSKIFAE